jgi:hypothetical protein
MSSIQTTNNISSRSNRFSVLDDDAKTPMAPVCSTPVSSRIPATPATPEAIWMLKQKLRHIEQCSRDPKTLEACAVFKRELEAVSTVVAEANKGFATVRHQKPAPIAPHDEALKKARNVFQDEIFKHIVADSARIEGHLSCALDMSSSTHSEPIIIPIHNKDDDKIVAQGRDRIDYSFSKSRFIENHYFQVNLCKTLAKIFPTGWFKISTGRDEYEGKYIIAITLKRLTSS